MTCLACVARFWHGRTPRSRADEYVRLMQDVAIPDYRRAEGNLGAVCLRSDGGAVSDIVMLSFWTSIEAVQRYGGRHHDRARYYDFDDDFLLEKEEFVRHYTCTGSMGWPIGAAHGSRRIV